MSDTNLTTPESNDSRPTDICYDFWSSVLDVTLGPTNIVPLPKYVPLIGDYNMPVEADPQDVLKLQFSDKSIVTKPMYCTAWMRSLDYLLYRHMTLTLQKYSRKNITVLVPPSLHKKCENYDDRSNGKKKHTFTFLPKYLSQPATHTKSINNYDYYVFQTSCCYEPALLNLFAHEIFTRSDNQKWREDPRRDALIWTDKSHGANAIANYGLESFIAHELLTGISLTTEITSALLEIDENIREAAFKKFCKTALNDVVRLPFPFARASAARDYFFQINLDFATEKYRWRRNYSDAWEQEVLERSSLIATRHIQLLEKTSFTPERPYYFWDSDASDSKIQQPYYFGPTYDMSFPKTNDPYQIDTYLHQIDTYLKAAISPLDWGRICDAPRGNLVVFTNPNHKYIPLLMRYLETGFLDKEYNGDKLPMNFDEFKSLFKTVHNNIKKASIKLNIKGINRLHRYINRN